MAEIDELKGIPDKQLAKTRAQIKADGGTVVSETQAGDGTWTVRASYRDETPAKEGKSVKVAPNPPGKSPGKGTKGKGHGGSAKGGGKSGKAEPGK